MKGDHGPIKSLHALTWGIDNIVLTSVLYYLCLGFVGVHSTMHLMHPK